MFLKGQASLPLPPLGDPKPVGEQLVPMGWAKLHISLGRSGAGRGGGGGGDGLCPSSVLLSYSLKWIFRSESR